MRAQPNSEAYQKIDLLTVVMHEFGHILGYADILTEGLMDRVLVPGMRYEPSIDLGTPDNQIPDPDPDPVNINPVAQDDSVSTNINTPISIDVLSNDFDANSDNLTIESVEDANNGQVVIDGSNIIYTPDAGFTGTDTFNYQISDGNGGTANASVSVEVMPTGTLKKIYSSTPGSLSIPDQGTRTSIISITDNYSIVDINIRLNINHTRTQDLDVFLYAPDGTVIELFTDVGGNGDNFVNTLLDDEAGLSITSASAPFTGIFKPEGDLSLLDGKSLNGEWTLEIKDDKKKMTGDLVNWSLEVEY